MFIDMTFDGVAEPKPVSPGRYNVTITDAKFVAEKSYIRVSVGIDDDLTAPNISLFIFLPKPDDDAGKVTFKKLMMKRFITQFRIPTNGTGFNVEDFPGAQANAQVSMREPTEDGTVYNDLKLDKLADESGTDAPRAGKKKA